MFRSLIKVAFALALTVTTVSAALADPAEDFYRANRVTMVVAGTPGAGYDLYARALAAHLGNHIPGHPNFIVQNMEGAGGLKAANYMYNVAPKDGSVIALLQNNNAFALFFEPKNESIKFDAAKFNWLGSPSQEVGLFVLNTGTGFKSIEDIKTKQFTVSSTSATSPQSIYANLINKTYGAKLRIINGYNGVPECLLAVDRGEVDGHVASASSTAWRTQVNPWIKAGKSKIIMTMAMTRDPEYPDAPTLLELVSSERDKKAIETTLAPAVTGRPFVAPPNVPAERVKVLRAAFDATFKDPAFIAEAKTGHLELNPVSGEQIAKLIGDIYATPPETADYIRSLVK
jgi:tripartite-type tricarboxylate transporter receptor subunit TctC